MVSSVDVDKLFNIGQGLIDLVLYNNVDIEDEAEFNAWLTEMYFLKTSWHKLLWSYYNPPIQQRLL